MARANPEGPCPAMFWKPVFAKKLAPDDLQHADGVFRFLDDQLQQVRPSRLDVKRAFELDEIGVAVALLSTNPSDETSRLDARAARAFSTAGAEPPAAMMWFSSKGSVTPWVNVLGSLGNMP